MAPQSHEVCLLGSPLPVAQVARGPSQKLPLWLIFARTGFSWNQELSITPLKLILKP